MSRSSRLRALIGIPSQPEPIAAEARLDYLDGWRGLALILVFIGHFAPVAGLNLGTIGVDLFFVLSGRLMADILFVRQAPLPLFFRRRFARIYPALLVFVLAAAALFAGTALRVGPFAVASALTLTVNYASLAFHVTGLYDHLWSLCVEEHTYILLGGLALLARRGRLPAFWLIAGLAAAGLANGIIRHDLLGQSNFQAFWRSDVQSAAILSGALAYLALRSPWATGPSRGSAGSVESWLAPLLLAAAIFCKSHDSLALVAFGLGTPLLALAVCLLDRAARPVKRLLALAPLRQIGLWSYSLYLWQQTFYKLHEQGAALGWTLPAALFCGVASFYLIEARSRRWLNRFDQPAAVGPGPSVLGRQQAAALHLPPRSVVE